MTRTVEPSRRKRFLYKAKGRARTRSPSPPLPSPPSPVFVSQTSAAASSSSGASNCLSAPSEAWKRSRTPESASDDDDDDDDDDETSEPPAKRQKRNGPRPLLREGAFYEYPSAPAPPIPAQRHDIHQNGDDDEEEEEPQTVHVNLIRSFLDQVQDLDVSSWLTRGPSDSKGADDDDDDGLFERGSSRMPRAELQDGPRRRKRRYRVRGGARADDEHGAMARRSTLGCTSPRVVSRT